MRLRLVTVAILLAVASRGDGRPKHPDPLDGSNRQEANVGNPDSRYMMTLTSSPTSNRRRDISITSVKFDSGSNKSKWLGRSMLPSLSLDNTRKNYLPILRTGTLSSGTSRSRDSSTGRNKKNRQSTSNNRSSMMIPFVSSVRLSTPKPIPVSIATQKSRKTLPHEQRKFNSHSLSLPIPIPVSIPVRSEVLTKNLPPRAERKMASRNLVKIIPQRLNTNYFRRNFTNKPIVDFKNKPIVDLNLKNWPNEVVQNVEDLFNYEKYTSLYDDQSDDNNKISTEVIKLPNNHEPAIKPVVEATSSTVEDIQIYSNTNIDNLLDDLGKDKVNTQLPSTQIGQNTVVHIMNTGSRKPNVTVVESQVAPTPNRTKTGSTRPPQNVHIMFMTDKDGNQTNEKPVKPVEITGGNSDCPTIMINSITQINNTIESKEGCTDLNIVINSHVLNTQIFKPGSNVQKVPLGSASDGVKDPYGQVSDNPSNNYQTNSPLNSYNSNNNYKPNPNYNQNSNYNPNNNYNPNPSYNQNSNYNPNKNHNPNNQYNNYNPTPNYNPNNNYNQNNNFNNDNGQANDKNPGNQLQSDSEASEFSEPGTQVSTFEVFQNTQINVGGSGFQSDVSNNVEDDSGSSAVDDSAGTDVDGFPLTDSTEATMNVAGTQGSAETQGVNDPVAADPSETAASTADATQGLSEPAGIIGDAGSAQSNDVPGAISLPSLPNVPNVPRPGQISNIASNLVGSGGPGSGGTSGADDDDDFDLLEAISPVNLLDSISSVFDSFSGLNPINYGILGMAVAPFVAFAAGIVGVAAFIFPWAFPGTFDVARSWDHTNTHVRVKVNPMIRDVVHSSIYEYKHLNEWKGRRRKRKRKR